LHYNRLSLSFTFLSCSSSPQLNLCAHRVWWIMSAIESSVSGWACMTLRLGTCQAQESGCLVIGMLFSFVQGRVRSNISGCSESSCFFSPNPKILYRSIRFIRLISSRRPEQQQISQAGTPPRSSKNDSMIWTILDWIQIGKNARTFRTT